MEPPGGRDWGPKVRIWTGNELNPMGSYQADTEGPFRSLSATIGGRQKRNSLAQRTPDPIRAVAEDEPLRPPEVRPLNQPRSTSDLSRPDRSAPLPDQAGHHKILYGLIVE